MLKRQNNMITIASGCISSLENDHRSWEQNPQIGKKVAEVKSDIQQALTLDQETENKKPSVYTIMLNNHLQIAVNLTSILCFKAQIYGRETNNNPVNEFFNYTARQLGSGSHQKMLDRCGFIVSKAQTLIEQLRPYGATPEEVAAAERQIAECRNLMGQRIAVQSERTNKLQQKADCVERIRKNLSTLDKMVEVFITDSTVIDRYKTARASKRFLNTKTTKRKDSQEAVAVHKAQ